MAKETYFKGLPFEIICQELELVSDMIFVKKNYATAILGPKNLRKKKRKSRQALRVKVSQIFMQYV